MKNLMIPALALFLSAAAQADDSPLWMRYCAISPDGQTIAFSYQGDRSRISLNRFSNISEFRSMISAY